jgi:very-long-chain ceramide synthase
MCVWGYLRHYINLKILWSILTEFRTVGPFDLNWETQQYKCWISQYITFALLASLQAVNLFWWFLICRIAYRFIASWGEDVRDDRSDDDEEEEEEEVESENKPKANGVANGAPTLLVNGEAPQTPEREIKKDEPGSIASRVRQRHQK